MDKNIKPDYFYLHFDWKKLQTVHSCDLLESFWQYLYMAATSSCFQFNTGCSMFFGKFCSVVCDRQVIVGKGAS